MTLAPRSFRPRSSTRDDASVLAVGRRVFVACPSDGAGRATVTDEAGIKPLRTLSDGTEVQIVAWRPRGVNGTRYRVRCPPDDLEGWLPARNLRGSRAPAPVPPTPAMPAPVPAAPGVGHERGDTHRRFGQRS